MEKAEGDSKYMSVESVTRVVVEKVCGAERKCEKEA